jgi:CheY-like chemotaxis protein
MKPLSNNYAAKSTTLPKEGASNPTYFKITDERPVADALRIAEDNRADLVLMDIQLEGGVSGIAAEAAAAIRGHLDIPVVFLTAHASAETVGRAVESGAFGYLLKPYTMPELKAAIDIALHKHTTEIAMRRALSSRLPADMAPQSI